jgi:hypothetical protein
MEEDVIVPVVLFTVPVLIVWLVQHFSMKKRIEAYKTLQLAIEKGQPLSSDILEGMVRIAMPNADLRRGIIFVSVAGAFAAFAGIIGMNASGEMRDVVRAIYGVAVFPLFLGLAFFGLHFFANDKKR